MGTIKKYYTPTIEEFYVGFEYEFTKIEPSGEYKTYEFPKYLSNATYIKYDTVNALGKVEYFLNEGQIRVKRLDREDIESLGFYPIIPSNVEERENYHVTWWTDDKYGSGSNVFLCYPYENNIYEINIGNPERSEKLFKGTIRNKSELKKLIQMLNIKT